MSGAAQLVESEISNFKALAVQLDWAIMHKAMKASLIVCSKDATRHALHSILVEADDTKVRLVATDGHRLLVVDVGLPCSIGYTVTPFALQLNRDDVEQWVKLTPAKCNRMEPPPVASISFWREAGRATISIPSKGSSYNLTPVTDIFPPYDQCMPTRNDEKKSRAVTGFAPQYLVDLGAVGKLLGGSRPNVRCQLGESELDPARFDITNNDDHLEATYVLMPCRL